jgi:hypothetical protein|tara:strand:- start:347 stop:571 length:225 start_codon:yes stop_codon:yes gene_type:complete
VAVVVEAEVIPIHVIVLKKVELEVQVLLFFNTQVLNKQLEEQFLLSQVAKLNIYLIVRQYSQQVLRLLLSRFVI